MAYEKRLVTLDQLFKKKRTGQPSLNALRERARGGFLVYEESKGPTQYYDEQLSELRLQAASTCKRPGRTWNALKRAFKALDKRNINGRLKASLGQGGSLASVLKFLDDAIEDEL
jgi:hypothetical protein